MESTFWSHHHINNHHVIIEQSVRMSRHGPSFHDKKRQHRVSECLVQKDHAFTTTQASRPKRGTIWFWIDIFQPTQQNIHHFYSAHNFVVQNCQHNQCVMSMFWSTIFYSACVTILWNKIDSNVWLYIVAIYVGYFGDLPKYWWNQYFGFIIILIIMIIEQSFRLSRRSFISWQKATAECRPKRPCIHNPTSISSKKRNHLILE